VSFVDLLLGRTTGPASTMTPRSMPVAETPYLDGSSVLGLSAVWRCVTLIADTIADMPWQEWRGDDLIPSSRLVRRPFALRTRRWWTWRMVATEALWNRAYALHVGGSDSAGSPWSLLPIRRGRYSRAYNRIPGD
jgi:phage portal protein BeeE